jgi:hypothetical protein
MPFNQPFGFYLTAHQFFMIYTTNYSIDSDLNYKLIAEIDINTDTQ